MFFNKVDEEPGLVFFVGLVEKYYMKLMCNALSENIIY